MLINSDDRFATLVAARAETQRHRRDVPSPEFYRDKLRTVWGRARRSPAYRELGRFTFEAFRDLPPTSKEELKSDPARFATCDLDAAAKYYETTGTTGRPTPTPRVAQDVIWNTVSVAEAWRALVGPTSRVLNLLPSDIVPVGDLIAYACEYLDLPHTRAYPFAAGVCDWDRIIGLFEPLRPTTVFLAPGVGLQLTRLLKQRGLLAPLSESVRELMLLGEVNTAPFRSRLGGWWGAKVFDASYGSTETGTIAAACPAGRQHLLVAAHYVELASDDGLQPPRCGAAGRLVVTPLNLHARSLLRLDTGDDAVISADCPCGDPSPQVTVQGRHHDAIAVRGVPLTVRGLEEVVFAATGATGYLVETDSDGRHARLILERDVDWERSREPALARQVQAASASRLGLEWDDVVFVNLLPTLTKSGAAQKSWKRSNVRLVEVGS